MKYILAIPTFQLLISISACVAKVEAASNEPPAKVVEYLLAIHEVDDVTNALPEIQMLWPDQPQAYERCVKHALDVLAGAPSSDVAKQASRRLFANVAGSSIPSNLEDSSSLLRLKCELILWCQNVPGIKDDNSTWLEIASVEGDVRSHIISDYVMQGRLNPPDIMQASSQEEAQRAIAENRKKVAADRWQQELRVTDRKLTMILMSNIKDVALRMSESQRGQFLERIKSLARLNEDENRELN